MKVKALSRSTAEYSRERAQDIHKVQRNLDPSLHPFEKAREYTRALNAVKVERMFAKPFVGALSGHADGVYCMAKHTSRLDTLISGSGDGELRIWSLSDRQTTWSVAAHKGIVKGVCASPITSHYLSCSTDKTVKIWDGVSRDPVSTYVGKYAFSALSHHRNDATFATGGSAVEIWDENRAEPVHQFSWGADTINTVRFNQTETSVLASCGTDRTIILYDMRTSQPLAKLVMTLKTNAIAWNPMEAFNFTTANEDHNLYTFDMRKMDHALNVYKDHVSAVLDVDYSPTGEHIVTGSYDRSLRIFASRGGHSTDIYHTKRMQRIFCVQFSMDSKYVISGSDDGNVRLWKARASERMGVKDYRERNHLEYADTLKKRYAHMPDIKRIDRHRHVPKAIKSAAATKRVMLDSRKQKEENLRRHSKPGTVERKAERKKAVVGVAK
ncbi:WD40-repeat-containing domain protein [Jimgerdemannia flammicorona]|uniref:WD40-repeat-containing domain protein n=1 Tax=Jimgerdemannia flammicorona TaxID=994334 RepID=A0A433CYW7_9FUNG|nr:WD40-repeat-containing domain protein [Jimgerdemannia flammicorona]